jgi:MFS family permease
MKYCLLLITLFTITSAQFTESNHYNIQFRIKDESSVPRKAFAGLSLGIAGAFTGGAIGVFQTNRHGIHESALVYILGGAFFGYMVGCPIGTYLSGKRHKENGRLWAAVCGSLACTGAGIALGITTQSPVFFPITLLAIPIGSAKTYEMSRR